MVMRSVCAKTVLDSRFRCGNCGRGLAARGFASIPARNSFEFLLAMHFISVGHPYLIVI